ncbi:IclR family transcriptional regulator [Hoeflea poritis]|uniref:IclR family transcriptional regulator n=1 Tax=Hoeflea poritis TaxID=2993659 RepID=A0ABT4VPN5_9HYPH|nr:IclR family transcriptional regulator [Hoeflea poritis]MDA4846120.1 IclR family transcriptional regulator [Hoeflea poritis]
MGTISNALGLLDHFSESQPEIGLADLRKLSGHDKATTYRYLTELVAFGMLEQDPGSKRYRLGPAVLRLANIRESVFPLRSAIQAITDRLSEATSETAHISLLQGLVLSPLAKKESPRHAARVSLSLSEMLPLHATASGLAIIAFSREDLLERAIKSPLKKYTAFTTTDAERLRADIAKTVARGFGMSDQGYEEEVFGIAVPFFDQAGHATGTAAVASPTSRMSDELAAIIKRALIVAARAITETRGGTIPEHLEEAWRRSGF